MLVLSRKENEDIVIGENVVITVVEIRGNKVRLGIRAPQEMKVLRSEVVLKIQNQRGEVTSPEQLTSVS